MNLGSDTSSCGVVGPSDGEDGGGESGGDSSNGFIASDARGVVGDVAGEEFDGAGGARDADGRGGVTTKGRDGTVRSVGVASFW